MKLFPWLVQALFILLIQNCHVSSASKLKMDFGVNLPAMTFKLPSFNFPKLKLTAVIHRPKGHHEPMKLTLPAISLNAQSADEESQEVEQDDGWGQSDGYEVENPGPEEYHEMSHQPPYSHPQAVQHYQHDQLPYPLDSPQVNVKPEAVYRYNNGYSPSQSNVQIQNQGLALLNSDPVRSPMLSSEQYYHKQSSPMPVQQLSNRNFNVGTIDVHQPPSSYLTTKLSAISQQKMMPRSEGEVRVDQIHNMPIFGRRAVVIKRVVKQDSTNRPNVSFARINVPDDSVLAVFNESIARFP